MRLTTEQTELIKLMIDAIDVIDPENEKESLKYSYYLVGMINGFISENNTMDSLNKVEEKTTIEDFSI